MLRPHRPVDSPATPLIDLAGQLPRAVLASFLGLTPATVGWWSRRIAIDWAADLQVRLT